MNTPNYKECYALFTKEIKEFKSAVTHYSEEFAAQGMKICLKHINAIRASVSKHTFSNPDEEITFFKEIKPDMVGHFIFYYHLHKIQSEKNINHSLKSYYSDKIQEYKDYF